MAYPIRSILTGAGMALAAAPGQGGVVASSDAGFVVRASVDVVLAPDSAYALLAEPGRWWNSAHTYSGDARNMVLSAKAGGCFCETLPDKGEKGASGSIEHARVVYAAPGQRLRLSGALGPLQSEAVNGVLDFAIAPAPGGSRVTLTYSVGGYMRGGLAPMAPIVDKVLVEQLDGYKRATDSKG
ncbi:SRPBCC family protein [Sphingobium yanoikuyae]|uniref:ATPase n=1 Tax=Sphingobium yanoikuyae TaxID=13690 RepID=A0A291N389_SPHYA|nr:ATPase [Sphingobium yanoikuyae]ATI81827.1 ATPase [Sphingobium yanoikuyae]